MEPQRYRRRPRIVSGREELGCWTAGCSVPILLGLAVMGVLVGANVPWVVAASAFVGALVCGSLLRSRLALLLAPAAAWATLTGLAMLGDIAGVRPRIEGGDPFSDGFFALAAMLYCVPLVFVGAFIGWRVAAWWDQRCQTCPRT